MKKAILAVVLAVAIGCGGGANLITGVDLLDFVASSQVTSANPMRFSSSVVVANTTTASIDFTPAACGLRTLVYSSSARTGTPVWDSKVREASLNCVTPSKVTLAVGKSVTYTLNATGAEVLGTSGTPGTYYLVDEITLDSQPVRINAGEVILAR